MRSVDWEHGPAGMNNIAPGPTTYPVSQVGHIMFAMYANNECRHFINVCLNNDAKGVNPIFLMQIKNKPHNDMQNVHLCLNSVLC